MKKLSKIFVTASIALVIASVSANNANADGTSFVNYARGQIGKTLTTSSAKELLNSGTLNGIRPVLLTNYEYQKIAKVKGSVYIVLDGSKGNYKIRDIKPYW